MKIGVSKAPKKVEDFEKLAYGLQRVDDETLEEDLGEGKKSHVLDSDSSAVGIVSKI